MDSEAFDTMRLELPEEFAKAQEFITTVRMKRARELASAPVDDRNTKRGGGGGGRHRGRGRRGRGYHNDTRPAYNNNYGNRSYPTD